MPRLPFTIARDAIFRRPNRAYFDPCAPRRPRLRSDDHPLLAHLDLGHRAPAMASPEKWLIFAVLAVVAVGLFVNWMQGGG